MGNIARARDLFLKVEEDPSTARAALLQAVLDSDSLVRHVAAVQLACHYPELVPEPIVREMVGTLVGEARWLDDEPAISREYTEATVTEDDCHDLGQDIALALACLPTGFDFAAVSLVHLWQGERQFYEAALAALALSFPPDGHPIAAELNDTQRSVLLALVADIAIWTYCGDTVPMLAERGLPTTNAEMRAFLDSVPGGPK